MTAAPQEWVDTYKRLRAALDAVPEGGTIPPETRALFKSGFDPSDNNRSMYIYGRLDTDKMIEIAKTSDIPWWPVAYGRAFYNDLAGLKKVYAAMPAKDRSDTVTGAYKWIAEAYLLSDGVGNDISAMVVRQLMEWKANVNADDGRWLEKSLRSYDSDSIRALVDHGATPATVYKVMDALLKENKLAQAGKIQEAISRDTVYFKIDDNTLLESKYIPAAEGGATLKAVFNFQSRRVNEIYEYGGADKRTAMTSVSFDDYDAQAIGFAEDQLRKLGGKPADPLGKPKLARLGG